jgi:hypothetical protein
MFIAAFVASQHDPWAKAYYQRKRAEGKKHNGAIILAVLKTATPYKPATFKPLDDKTGTPPRAPSPLRVHLEPAEHARLAGIPNCPGRRGLRTQAAPPALERSSARTNRIDPSLTSSSASIIGRPRQRGLCARPTA